MIRSRRHQALARFYPVPDEYLLHRVEPSHRQVQLMILRRATLQQQHPSPSLDGKTNQGWGCSRHSNRHARRNTNGRKVRSKIRWFTEFCNSHYLSHFAAFFIDARAKRSVVKSFISYNKTTFVTIMFSIKVDASIQQFTGVMDRITNSVTCWHIRTEATDDLNSIMILPQVHLRKPCYDFYFL